MKFRLRRQAAPVAQPTVPTLTQDQIFAIVHEKMAELIGSHGTWVVTRRSAGDGDPIFHDMLARSVAHEISTAIHLENVRGGDTTEGLVTTTTPARVEIVTSTEPASLGWSPNPITVWADGEVAPDRVETPNKEKAGSTLVA